MSTFITNIFNLYIIEFGRVFSQSNKALLLMLFSVVLLTIVFKICTRQIGVNKK